MISRKNVAAAIDDADAAFQRCWTTLANMKGREVDTTWRDEFVAFQHRLALALFKLEEVYRSVAARERDVIMRKGSVSRAWFVRTIRRLTGYRNALKRAMRIGRRLGDSFAWLFYQREVRMLRRHLEHPGNLHMPPGIGGRGEVSLMKHLPVVDGHIVIYHGITSFLRIGDISIIDLQTLELAAIGELKTKQEGNTYITSIFLLADEDLRKRLPSMRRRPRNRRRSWHEDMPAAKADQLKRQMARMGEVLDVRRSGKRFDVRTSSNLEKLEVLLAGIRSDKITYRRIDDGLTAFGIRARKKTKLSSRLMPQRGRSVRDLSEGVENYALQLMTPDRSINSLQYIPLRLRYQLGMTPLLWSPLSADLLKPLVFDEALVAILFNAAPLIQKLRSKGYQVELDADRMPERILRPGGSQVVGFEGVWYLLDLIRYQFLSEDAIVAMVNHMFDLIDREGVSSNVRVEIDFQQFFDEAPPAF